MINNVSFRGITSAELNQPLILNRQSYVVATSVASQPVEETQPQKQESHTGRNILLSAAVGIVGATFIAKKGWIGEPAQKFVQQNLEKARPYYETSKTKAVEYYQIIKTKVSDGIEAIKSKLGKQEVTGSETK